MRKRAIRRGQVSVPSDVRRKLQIGSVPVRAFRGSGPGGQVAALLRERKRDRLREDVSNGSRPPSQDYSAAARSKAPAISARVFRLLADASRGRARDPAVAHDQDLVGQGTYDPELVAVKEIGRPVPPLQFSA